MVEQEQFVNEEQQNDKDKQEEMSQATKQVDGLGQVEQEEENKTGKEEGSEESSSSSEESSSEDSSSNDQDDEESKEEKQAASKTEAYKFGFEMKYSNLIPESFFAAIEDMQLLEFNPEQVSPPQRQIEKFRIEMEQFDAERYANDNYDEETLEEIKRMQNEGLSLSGFIYQI